MVEMEDDSRGECDGGHFFYSNTLKITHHPLISSVLSCETKEGGAYKVEGVTLSSHDSLPFLFGTPVLHIVWFHQT